MKVHGKTTYEWHTDNIRVHTSDIRMTHEYIRVTYGWYTSTYEWHTDDIQVHTSDIRMAYEWHAGTYCFGLFTKIKKGSGISFWCTFSAWIFYTNATYLILIDDVINFKIYLQSSSKKMTEVGGMRGSQKYKNMSISRTKRTF